MAAEKRARDVLGAARRQRRIEVGSDAVEEALERNEAHLVVVACDARAAAETTGVRRAVASGRACAWGNKERLGRICGRSEVGVLAVTEERLATALFEAIALSHLQGPPGLSGEADVLTEVE
jgi:ribosomal protein L7Ae-like RNA K-turn-binding protein